MDTEELVKELQEMLETLEKEGGVYKDQLDRYTEITRILESRGFPVEVVEFVEETKH